MTQEHIRFGALDASVAVVMNIMWGLNLIAVKMAVDLIEPLTAAMLRQFIVLLVCIPALKLMPGKMRELLALGLLSGCLFYIVVNVSLAVSTNIGALAIAGQLGAPFSLILAVVFLGERIARYRIAGMTLSFCGVVLLVFDPAAVNEIPGLLLTAVASLIWAICSLIQRRLVGVPLLTIYAWVGLVGSLTMVPIAWAIEPQAFVNVPNLPLSALGWVAFSAIGSTVIGQGATPVISVIAATLYFKTPMTPVMIAGGIIVMIGVAIVTIRTAKVGERHA
jgi:O-acetylserine/cysteine efflux transporter